MSRRGILVSLLVAAVTCGVVAAGAAAAPSTVLTIRTVAGSGLTSDEGGDGLYAGDGGPAAAALLGAARDVSVTDDGGYLIASPGTNTIRAVSPAGVISRAAGTGTAGFSGDGGPATAAQLNQPTGVAALPGGGFLVADRLNNRIRRVSADGVITTVAGTGEMGFSEGTVGPGIATSSKLFFPQAVDPTADGGFLIADTGNGRIRKVAANGVIATLAGGPSSGTFNGADAKLVPWGNPVDVLALPDGGFLSGGYTGGGSVMHVRPDRSYFAVAGGGAADPGDGGPATDARILNVGGIALAPDGTLYISEADHQGVRRVTTAGVITTYAAGLGNGFSGDNGKASQAKMMFPAGLDLTSSGALLVADSGNLRIRRIAQSTVYPPSTHLKKASIFPGAHKAVFRFASSEPGATFRCRLDKGKFKPCSSPRAYRHLAAGKHSFRVKASGLGGPDTSPATRRFRIPSGG